MQARVFSLLGISAERQKERFAHILEAFSYGAPPHGGFATGIDRLIMNLVDEPNIREVMAFPKMGLGYDPLIDSPSKVDEAHCRSWGCESCRTRRAETAPHAETQRREGARREEEEKKRRKRSSLGEQGIV